LPEPLKSLKWYKELADVKHRRHAGVFLAEGERAIRQLLAQDRSSLVEILAHGELPADFSSFPLRILTPGQLKSISSSVTPHNIMAIFRLPEDSYSDNLPGNPGRHILLLEDIQDPGNIGTLIRTAAAFDYDGIILSDKCADPFSPRCVQASAGSVLSIWIRRTDRYLHLAGSLREQNFNIVAATLDGNIDTSPLTSDRLLLALGNEGAGISSDLLHIADYRFRLPVNPSKAESLNVAVCGGICMYLSTR